MKIGVIGAGNMASALVRGWDEPVVVADIDGDRANALAEAVGGSVAGSNAEVAEQADVVILCHKPAQLDEVAEEIRAHARAVVSILGGVSVATVEAAYPDTPVYRFMPNQAAAVSRGVSCYVGGTMAAEGPEQEILDLFGRVGAVVPLPEGQMETATAVMSCAPAWFALVAEALVDAGVEHGLEREEAGRLVEQRAGARQRGRDEAGVSPAEVRRRVTSPGGLTERGTARLEDAGIRAAFDSAVDAVVNPS